MRAAVFCLYQPLEERIVRIHQVYEPAQTPSRHCDLSVLTEVGLLGWFRRSSFSHLSYYMAHLAYSVMLAAVLHVADTCPQCELWQKLF